eukprot:CAMPEP_0119517132 /NCGR_PEP_ID=MMETSP1344-20130328/34112_1 /TAXON_ID=236787 /ORGANISM="Florenciella parvula, Strain CCMP2471" /LENGTH=443 /DNA_ID=CAMNT_0007554691 /DNA_START=105 /DNA_END=1432 /DNA_ORIENTATION=+
MATPTVYRRAFYVVATDEDAFERCCHDVSEAIRHSSAVELEHDNFAQGVPEAEDMLAEHALVAMQSNDCQSYSEDSLLMMNMMTKFKLVTSKYMKMSSEMQSILWKYLPQQVEEFSVVDAPMYQVANGRVGNYEALEMIGHGKFGQIISCRDLNTDRHIVLKKMSKSFVKSISTLKRVTTEIKLLRNASNAVEMANLLPIEEVFQTNSHFYYTMARYGQDVFEFMKLGNHSTLGAGFENSVIIFAHVCEALSFMHGHGCAHRDIKSENVLVEYDPMPNGLFLITGVKVIDLGLACAVNDEMTRRESCGSRGFMAPEGIVRMVEQPTLLDSWSLACLGLEIILGRIWFTEVWFEFFKAVQQMEEEDADLDVDFGPLQQNIDHGLNKSAEAGAEPRLLLALQKMLMIDSTRRIEVAQVRADLRMAYDVPGGRFNGVGIGHTAQPA